MSTHFSLLKLQEFDTKIDEAAKRLTIIGSALNDQGQLAKAENLHEAITSKLNSLTSDRKKLERDIEDLSEREHFQVVGEIRDFFTRTSVNGNKYMILSLRDNTATKNFLFMDNRREEKLTEFLANNKKLAKNL